MNAQQFCRLTALPLRKFECDFQYSVFNGLVQSVVEFSARILRLQLSISPRSNSILSLSSTSNCVEISAFVIDATGVGSVPVNSFHRGKWHADLIAHLPTHKFCAKVGKVESVLNRSCVQMSGPRCGSIVT